MCVARFEITPAVLDGMCGKGSYFNTKMSRNKSKMREGIVRMIERGIYVALVMHSCAAVLQAGVVSNRTMYNDFQNRK